MRAVPSQSLRRARSMAAYLFVLVFALVSAGCQFIQNEFFNY